MESKKIIIVGAGYGGIATAKSLLKKLGSSANVDITLIEKNSYHTLLTELHEVAAGRVRPRAVKIPYEDIFGNQKSKIKIVQDEILHIDYDVCELTSLNNRYSYDYLVISTGSRPEFFGIEGVENHGFKLWSYKEAVVIRDHIYDCFYHASQTPDNLDQKSLLTFVIAGGGFTGVEMAGELANWCKSLCKIFSIPSKQVSIQIIEAMPSILNVMSKKIRQQTMNYLTKLEVQVFTGCGIQQAADKKMYLSNGQIVDGTLIWTAGIKGNPYIQKTDIHCDRRGRILVNEFLQSTQYDNVFSNGDSISYMCQDKPVPQVVENAMQSGENVAKNIYNSIYGNPLVPYTPGFHGVMISIGPRYAVAKLGKIQLKGIPATIMKHFVHGHYQYVIGGPALAVRYLKEQFILKYVDPIITPQNEPHSKQVTQFL